MKVGLIGLGKMGLNLGQNLMDHNHSVVAFDLNTAAVEDMKSKGAEGAAASKSLCPSWKRQESCGSWCLTPL